MLVLSRKLGESVLLGNDIRVTVISIDRGKIRLGFEAPRDVEIYRQEIYDQINGVKTPGGVPALPAAPVLPQHLAG
jgi:carbon storage regulator